MLRTCVVLALLPFTLLAQSPPAPLANDAQLEKELTRVARARILTFDKGDPALWSPFIASRYFIATPSGAVRSREQEMQAFRPPLAGYSDEFHFEDVQVWRDGDTAMMTYRIVESEDWDGQKVLTQPLHKTDTYVFRKGHWLILGSQETFYPAKPRIVTVATNTLEAYSGVYRVMRSLSYRIAVEDGTLVLQEIGQPEKTALQPESETMFFAQNDTARYIFVRSAAGRVERILIRNNGYDLKAEKIE